MYCLHKSRLCALEWDFCIHIHGYLEIWKDIGDTLNLELDLNFYFQSREIYHGETFLLRLSTTYLTKSLKY